MFEKVYIINLKERADRLENIKKELEKVNIMEYTIFPAIKPDISEVPDTFLPNMSENYRIGCWGCLSSHHEIIKSAKENNLKKILILEDDVEFVKNLEIPFVENFGLLYLSGSHIKKCDKITQNLVKVNHTLTTSSYIIDEQVYDVVLQLLKSWPKEIDSFYAEAIQHIYPCYCVSPHLTRQREGFSDIQGKNVSYAMSSP